ncbi:MAG: hypothetical protein IJP61_11600 [Treponema sp.]|nr:hypothetical protein [Treponema sp.]
MISALSSLSDEDKKIFDEYCENHFGSFNENPDDDLSFLIFWREFVSACKKDGAANAINTMLVPNMPVTFKQAEKISAEIYNSVAGEIPVIKIRNTDDFENLVTNLFYKGKRPENISSTGASFVSGKKTQFIILSQKPYSNVSAKTLGLNETEWLEKSLQIRLEHECTHFFTKKFFGTAQNHLHDELVADFFGITSAFGFYKAEYFEYFMGIKGNEGSRISCYIPKSSENLFAALKETASRAASYIEDLSKKEDFNALSKKEKIRLLCEMNILRQND